MLYMADAYMGKAHVTADQIGDYNAGVSGSGCVLNVGEKLRAEIVNTNLVRIYDGAFIFQGYRRSGITAGSYEDVTIENGTQAQKRNDLICAKYEKDAATSKENLTLVVIKGTPGDTASDPEIQEGDVRSGSAVCYMPLYRVKLDGINLTAVEKLFTVRKTLEEIEGDVAALNSQIPRILYGNLYSSAVLRCTTLGTAVEKSFSDVDINNVNAIGVNVAIPDIGRHFCLLPKLSTDAGPRCCFSYLGTVDYYVYGYVEVDWKNKKIKFLVKSLKGWDISLIYVSHIFLFQ